MLGALLEEAAEAAAAAAAVAVATAAMAAAAPPRRLDVVDGVVKLDKTRLEEMVVVAVVVVMGEIALC